MDSSHESHDTQIRHQIEQLLVTDKRTKDAVIDVACVGGVVTLTGDVKKADTRTAAETIARSVPRVIMVTNELRVR